MRQVFCLGASFNPIHHGHLICARAAAEAAGFDRVRLIPSASPPHKRAEGLAPAADRLAMTELAIDSDSLFEVDARELRRHGPSYTLDTVREFRAEGYDRVTWLIGADMLATLATWHESRQLLQEAQFLILARPGWSLAPGQLPEMCRPLLDCVVAAPLIDISATDIRRRVAADLPIHYLTTPAVCNYIRDRGLYRDASAG